MKKYLSFLFVFVTIFGSFSFNLAKPASASVPGCLGGAAYSSTTGQLCGTDSSAQVGLSPLKQKYVALLNTALAKKLQPVSGGVGDPAVTVLQNTLNTLNPSGTVLLKTDGKF